MQIMFLHGIVIIWVTMGPLNTFEYSTTYLSTQQYDILNDLIRQTFRTTWIGDLNNAYCGKYLL